MHSLRPCIFSSRYGTAATEHHLSTAYRKVFAWSKWNSRHIGFLQEEYRSTPEAKRAKAIAEATEQTGQMSPDYNQYDPAIWGSSALPASPLEDRVSMGGSPGSTMDITNRTADLANQAFLQPGLDSPSVTSKPFGDITAGLQSFADLAADMATTDELGWEHPARQELPGNITAGVPALSTLLEEDEEGRTSTYGDENMSVNMDLTAEAGTAHLVLHFMQQACKSCASYTG